MAKEYDKIIFQNGEESRVSCPECGEFLVVRTNHHNGGQFLGCPRYPECTGKAPIPDSWYLRAASAQMLPGLEEI